MSNDSTFIIFLKGITSDDYKNIEDEFTDRLLENIDSNDVCKTDNFKYNSIEPLFISLDSWKTCSNLNCWVCNFTFNTRPIFIPLNIKSIDIDNEEWNISVLGNFCSFPCASRYIVDYMTEDLHNNLIKLYWIFNKVTVKKIGASPRRHVLLKYGGYMNDEAYLSHIRRLTYNIELGDNIKKEYIQNKTFNDNESDEETLWNVKP